MIGGGVAGRPPSRSSLLRHRGASFSLTEGGSTPHEQKEGDEQVSVSRILADRSNTWFPGGEVDVEKKKRVHS